jgi:hypothetical protein
MSNARSKRQGHSCYAPVQTRVAENASSKTSCIFGFASSILEWPRMLLTDDAKHGERSMPHSGDYKCFRVKSNFIRLVESSKENLDGFFTLFR